MIYNNISEIIGKTPILRLGAIEKKYGLKAKLYAKLEYFNPTGSVKDRAAKNMILKAINEGKINKDTVVIEPTSGNTGIGIASVCSALSIRAIIVMPENMSRERQVLTRAYGAEVVLTPKELGMKGAVEKAKSLAQEFGSAFIPSQFDNPDNKDAHILSTGPEIYEDMNGRIDYFVAGIGTGGTVSGVGEYLKRQDSGIKIIGVEPASSPLITEGKAAPHKIQGIGANFVPDLFNADTVDEVLTVSNEDAYGKVRELGTTMGVGVGISSGAALSAAISIAKREEAIGKNIVVLFPDGIDRYLSTDLFD